MNIAVRYYTRSGNTAKLAHTIAEAVGVKAEDVSAALPERVDALFLGSSLYAFDVDDAIKSFVAENRDRIGRIVNFGTAASPGSTYKKVKKLAEKHGLPMDERKFHCQGSFGPMNKGRPNDRDLERAKAFARAVIE